MERRRSPFPGMDPYLEHPARWRGLHSALVTYLHDDLQPALPPRYYAAMEDRVFVDSMEYGIAPDVRVIDQEPAASGGGVATVAADTALVLEARPEPIEEHYIEIRDVESGHRVVTVIEILSPTNKRETGNGVDSYRAKQAEILQSDTNLVEIDLLRAGRHVLSVPQGLVSRCRPYDYLVAVRRAPKRHRWEVYPTRLRARLPRIAIPLVPPDPDVVADLQSLVDRAYERGAYGRRTDYRRPPEPPLAAEDEAWAQGLLVAAQEPAGG